MKEHELRIGPIRFKNLRSDVGAPVPDVDGSLESLVCTKRPAVDYLRSLSLRPHAHK